VSVAHIVMIYAKAFFSAVGPVFKDILCLSSKDLGSMAREASIEQFRCTCRGAN